MIKCFCDKCGNEMPDGNTNPIYRKDKNITVEIRFLAINAGDSGQVCINCIVETAAKGKTVKK